MCGQRPPYSIQAIFGKAKVAIGFVHCLALPGTPRHQRVPSLRLSSERFPTHQPMSRVDFMG